MTVGEMRARMSAQEFTEWAAFHAVEAAQREKEAKKRPKGRR